MREAGVSMHERWGGATRSRLDVNRCCSRRAQRLPRFLTRLAIGLAGAYLTASAAPPQPPARPSEDDVRRQVMEMMGKGAAPARESPDAVEVVIQTGHAATITAVAISRDGRLVASGSMDESVKLWDVASGQEVRSLAGQGPLWPTAVTFSSDGARLLVSDALGSQVYDTASGAALFRLNAGGLSLLLSTDGRLIVGQVRGDSGSALAVIDARTGKALWTVPAPAATRAVALAANGRMLATATPLNRRANTDATASETVELNVWNLDTRARVSHCQATLPRPISATIGALSADGRLLVLETAGRDLAVFDAATGATLRTLVTHAPAASNMATTLAFSPDGHALAWATSSDIARIWSMADGQEIAAFEASALNWSADGATLVLGHGSGGAPVLRNLQSGAETALAAGAAAVADLALIPGGRAALAAMRDGSARWWDLATGEIVLSYPCPGGAAATSVAASRTEPRIALGCADGSASVWDAASGARPEPMLAALSGEFAPVMVRFAPDGHTLIAARRDELTIWNTQQKAAPRRIKVPPPPTPPGLAATAREAGQWITTVAVSPDGQRIAVGQRTALTLWNLATGELVGRLVGSGILPGSPSRGPASLPQGGDRPGSMTAGGGMLGGFFGRSGGAPGLRMPGGSGNPLEMLNAQFAAAGAYSAAFSSDGRWLLSVGLHGRQLWDLSSGQEVRAAANVGLSSDPREIIRNSPIAGMLESAGAVVGRATSRRGAFGQVIAFSPDGRSAARAVGRVIKLWELATDRELGELAGHTSDVTALSFSDDGTRLLSGGADGALRVWSIAARRELAALTALGPRDFVAVTPDQYYRASKSRLKGVSFRVHGGFYPFEQFDLRYNRPDVVLERLGLAAPELTQSYRHAYQRRLRKMGFTEARLGKDFHLPEIELVTRDVPVATPGFTLALTVRGRDSQYPLDRFLAYVNDVPVFGSGGVPVASHAPTAETTLTVPLVSGRNKIQISVLNQEGVESLRDTLYTHATGPRPPADVWVVTIGVSHYQNTRYDLRFAAKDARDVAQLFASHPSAQPPTDHQVRVLAVTDAQATREGIRAARGWLQAAHPQDLVVVFVAGHGLTDAEQNYYFGTYDIDADRPAAHGLPFEDLESLLDGIPALQKLLLVDTCFSGEIERDAPETVAPVTGAGQVTMRAFKALRDIKPEANTGPVAAGPAPLPAFVRFQQDWFADLRRGTGAAVISSASGNEFALEGEQWRNGVFTYAVIDGLRNGKADLNGDGVVTVSELESYVMDVVRSLTAGKQNPTVRRENLEYDFAVY